MWKVIDFHQQGNQEVTASHTQTGVNRRKSLSQGHTRNQSLEGNGSEVSVLTFFLKECIKMFI